MKAIITENISHKIEGYITIPVIYGKIQLNDIPSNALQEIVAIDFIDKIAYADVDTYLQEIVSKMRIGCELKIRGIDLSILAKNIINNVITSEEFNKLINNTKSLHKYIDIVNLLKNKGLCIDEALLSGTQYEINAHRLAPSR